MKKKPKKRIPEQIPTDSDEHFAYIAGYTEGGAPYGVTWEEMEAVERSVAAPRSVELMKQGGAGFPERHRSGDADHFRYNDGIFQTQYRGIHNGLR
ncbi:MAG: hypothetical protein PHY09_18235 [Desulfuromonadaceae bacterium]|nr:hypothetical protein [Desulfuromonadaceae bacterium]MDD5107331.1 hypothetical protein [Desulfuromonadaceae bacterium]